MTISHDTRFSILLDHDDLNGLIDIADFGVEAMVKHQLSRKLLQSLAEIIVEQATGHKLKFVPVITDKAGKAGDPDTDLNHLNHQLDQPSQPIIPEQQYEDKIKNREAIEGQALLTIQRLITLEQATETSETTEAPELSKTTETTETT